MATVDEVFSALREFPTVSERGTAFEKLMVRFLLEDKTFRIGLKLLRGGISGNITWSC